MNAVLRALNRPIPPRLIVYGAMAVAAAWWELIAVLRYQAFEFYDWDLAIFSQLLWNMSHGHAWSSLLHTHLLGNHANFFAYFLVPLYRLLPHPVTLMSVKTACCVLAALPLYRVAQRKLGGGLALCLVAAFLLYPPLTHVLDGEFDYEALSPVFLMWLWVAFVENRRRLFVVMAILCCLLKENLPLLVSMFGIAGLWCRKDKRWWGGVTIAASLWFVVVVFLVVPWFRGGEPSVHWWHYAQLASPSPETGALVMAPIDQLAQWWTSAKQGKWLWQLFAPTALTALLGLEWVLLGLPVFLQHALSRAWQAHTILFHYSATLTPFIFMGTVEGLARLRRWGPMVTRASRPLGMVLVGSSLWTQALWGPMMPLLIRPEQLRKTELDAWRAALVQRIPPEVGVLASFQFLPQLSQRAHLYSLHTVYEYHQPMPPEVQYLLVDAQEARLADSVRRWPGQYQFLAELSQAAPWHVEEAIDNLVLLHRETASSARPLYDVVGDDQGPSWQLEAGVRLRQSATPIVASGRPGSVAEIELIWQLDSRWGSNCTMTLIVVDSNRQVVKWLHHPVGYRLYPMMSWKPGVWIRERVPLLLPRSLPSGSYEVLATVVHEANGQPLRVVEDAGDGRQHPTASTILLGTLHVTR